MGCLIFALVVTQTFISIILGLPAPEAQKISNFQGNVDKVEQHHIVCEKGATCHFGSSSGAITQQKQQCKTTNESGSLKKNVPCQFPFRLNGKTYDACTD